MSNFNVSDGSIGGQGISEISATLKNRLGRELTAVDTASSDYGYGTFIYLKGVASTTVGSVVTFDRGDYQTALSVANAIGSIGVAMADCVAGQYGWYQISGRSVMNVKANFAANKVAYLSSTAGNVDDAVVTGDEVFSSYSFTAIATPAAGKAEVSIDRPFTTNASN